MTESIVQVQHLRKAFRTQRVLEDVSFEVSRGRTFALLGRNGAGKTTTLRLLLGLLAADEGIVQVLGCDPSQEPLALRRRIGYLAEDQAMYPSMTPLELCRFLEPFYPTWDRRLADDFLDRFELPRHARIGRLSKGQSVKLGLAVALTHRPELAILDDPALGLDPIARKEFNRDLIEHLQTAGCTVIYSSHLLEEVESELIGMVTAVNLASSIQLLLILSVIGTRRRAESHLGFIGVCGACLWLLLHTVPNSRLSPSREGDYLDWLGAIMPQSLVIVGGYGGSEDYYGDLNFTDTFWAPWAANLPVLAALAWWFTLRYGTARRSVIEGSASRLRWRLPVLFSRLPIRWPSRAAALIWLDLRQALPVCLAGLVLAALLAAANVLSPHPHFDSQLPQRIAGRLTEGIWITAILWGAVVGAGVFAGEFQPRLEQFWRSRPISPSLWFWVKFGVGLAAVLGVLDLTAIVLAWKFPYADGSNIEIYAYLACFPLLHALTYTLAVLAICWLRRGMLAGLAAILSLFIVFPALQAMPGGADPIDVYNKLSFGANHLGEPLDFTKHGYPMVYGAIAALIVAAALAAWRGARRPSLGKR